MTTNRQAPNGLAPYFTSQYFKGTFELNGKRFELEATTPDLQDAPTRVWGDWGPMYTCELDIEKTVSLTYTDLDTGEQATYHISPPTIEVNSPALLSRRLDTPLQLEIVDAARSVRIIAPIDRGGRIRDFEVKPTSRWGTPAKLIFREARMRGTLEKRPRLSVVQAS